MVLIRDGKEMMRVRKISAFKLVKDDVVSIRTGAGGGWGVAFERDPELVLTDVRNEFITSNEAAKTYGVVVDASEHSVDYEGTRTTRESIR